MPHQRHIIVGAAPPHLIADAVIIQTDPEAPDYETLTCSSDFFAVITDEGRIGQFWQDGEAVDASNR